jgi:hypothetical protein
VGDPGFAPCRLRQDEIGAPLGELSLPRTSSASGLVGTR